MEIDFKDFLLELHYNVSQFCHKLDVQSHFQPCLLPLGLFHKANKATAQPQ